MGHNALHADSHITGDDALPVANGTDPGLMSSADFDKLGAVQEEVVSQVDAEAGTDTNPFAWTPERVAQAIAALGVNSALELESAQPGDMIYYDNLGEPQYAPAGLDGDVLQLGGVVPGWQSQPTIDLANGYNLPLAGLAALNPGDLIAVDGLGVTTVIPTGGADEVLRAEPGQLPSWGKVDATELAPATGGDIIAFDSSNNPQLVPAGNSGDVLISQGADLPAWTNEPTLDLNSSSNLPATSLASASPGEIIAFDSIGNPVLVPAGTVAQVLKSQGTDQPVWDFVAVTELAPATAGDIIAFDSLGVATLVPASGAGAVLISQGADVPTWADQPLLDLTNASNLPATSLQPATAGDIIAFDSSGDPQLVAAGIAGEVLVSQGADVPAWGFVPVASMDPGTDADLLAVIGGQWASLPVGNEGDVLQVVAGAPAWSDPAGPGTIQGTDGTYDLRPTDEGATAGDPRGENTVDLCTQRSNDTYVCAGINSGALAGEDVGGTGTHSAYLAGQDNYGNSGNHTAIAGSGNFANTGNSCLISGEGNSGNTGLGCLITGQGSTDNNLDFARVHGGGEDCRIIDLVAKASTNDATPKAITLGGAAEGAAGSIIIPANTAWAFVVHVVALNIDALGNSKKFSFDGLVLNNGGTVTVTSQTLGTNTTIGTFTGTVALSADATNDALKIEATGIAATNIRWTARIELTQVD